VWINCASVGPIQEAGRRWRHRGVAAEFLIPLNFKGSDVDFIPVMDEVVPHESAEERLQVLKGQVSSTTLDWITSVGNSSNVAAQREEQHVNRALQSRLRSFDSSSTSSYQTVPIKEVRKSSRRPSPLKTSFKDEEEALVFLGTEEDLLREVYAPAHTPMSAYSNVTQRVLTPPIPESDEMFPEIASMPRATDNIDDIEFLQQALLEKEREFEACRCGVVSRTETDLSLTEQIASTDDEFWAFGFHAKEAANNEGLAWEEPVEFEDHPFSLREPSVVGNEIDAPVAFSLENVVLKARPPPTRTKRLRKAETAPLKRGRQRRGETSRSRRRSSSDGLRKIERPVHYLQNTAIGIAQVAGTPASHKILPAGKKVAEKSPVSRWTVEQDEQLRHAVSVFGAQNWKYIAEHVEARNHVQCLQRWNKVLQPGLIKGAWSEEEDQLLLSLIAKFGSDRSWSNIAENIPGRTPKQCRERWSLNLDPSINRGPWTMKEDEILLSLHKRLGNKWAEIRRYLPGRTENGVKSRFKSIQRAFAKTHARKEEM